MMKEDNSMDTKETIDLKALSWQEKVKLLKEGRLSKDSHGKYFVVEQDNDEEKQMAEALEKAKAEAVKAVSLGNRVSITPDLMSADVIISPKEDDSNYTPKEIKMLIEAAGIKQGIDEKTIEKICSDKIYFTPVVIAHGKQVEDGVDGFFTYFFRKEIDKKPKINEDGSTDYFSIDMIEAVEKGQILAKYTPPTAGEFGYTVTGKLLIPKKGKTLPRHRGKGIYSNEEQTEYYASFNGKVELKQGAIIVSKLHQVKGNVDLSCGNIDFDGDVKIVGEVISGMTIKATGNVEISGHVGAATIIAGKDVLLKSGMQGDEVGSITAGGNVSGKFFETVKIKAEGNIRTNYLFKCIVESEMSLKIAGSKGAIVGGEITALFGVEAHYLGNEAGMETMIKIGIGEKYINKYNNLVKKITKLRSEETLLEKAVGDFTSDEPKKFALNEDLYNKICQALEIKKNEIENEMTRRHEMLEVLAKAKDIGIKVKSKSYDGVTVQIDTALYRIKGSMGAGEFKRTGENIIFYK